MICPKCHAQLPDNLRFCTQCGAPVPPPAAPAQPVQPAQPAQPVQPTQHAQPNQSAQYVQPTAPVNTYGEAPAKAHKKFNPLAIVIPVISVIVLAAAAAVLYFTLFSKPSVTIADFEKALADRDFETALELSETLEKSDCEKAIENYIIQLLSADGEELSRNERIIEDLFSEGFDKYKKLHRKYENGDLTPVKPVTEEPERTEDASSAAEPELNDTTSAPVESQPEPIYSTYETSEPTEEAVPELTLEEMLPGHWRREVRSGCYEDIVFLDDGTGYIYSDIVSEKPSDTNSSYLYYDGRIHFEWQADSDRVFINAEINPYCFVAYQGYAAPGHQSNATWKGSKNGSHDYYFSFETEGDYLCDMLGLGNTSELYTGTSLTRDYWTEFLGISYDAWDKYFNHSDEIDLSRYKIDYSTLADYYYDSPELRAQYEDVDQYHFVPFTKMVLIGTDNPTSINLNFDLEDYYRAD